MAELYTWPEILTTLLDRRDLSVSESTWAMRQVMAGSATPSQLGGFLVALRAKGETVDEIVGFRDAILEAALPLAGGSRGARHRGHRRRPLRHGQHLDAWRRSWPRHPVFPSSSTATGRRAPSSGSSDVLSALGIDLTLSPEAVAETLARTGITFAFASAFHPGFRHAGPTRAELGVPTVFNFLGPLCNPARAEANAVGVAHLDRVPLITGVFRTRGATALVFRGDDGLDELTTTGHSRVWEVSRGDIHEHDLDPRDLGIPIADIGDLLGRRSRAQRGGLPPGARWRDGRGARHRAAQRGGGHRRRIGCSRMPARCSDRSWSGSPRRRTTAAAAIDSGAARGEARAMGRGLAGARGLITITAR